MDSLPYNDLPAKSRTIITFTRPCHTIRILVPVRPEQCALLTGVGRVLLAQQQRVLDRKPHRDPETDTQCRSDLPSSYVALLTLPRTRG